ncbi:MAG: TetR/AcrR family transcriptional regulator [Bryobacteraceae bacterium]
MIEKVDTKGKILDTAEKLFGLNGFDTVSLRDITTGAGVNLAAVNYHFQSKDTLVDAVIARRIEPVNCRRMAMLDALGPNPSVEEILEAFLQPVFEVQVHPLVPLIGRVMSNPDLFVDRLFNTHLAPVALRFSAALANALPELPLVDVAWRLHFSVGVMTHTLLWGKVFPRMTNGLCTIDDREALLRRSVQFLAAGFRTPASNSN